MTRFNITMNEALDLILRVIKNARGGEVFIPKLKAYKVIDMKNAILEILKSKTKTQKIPIRPGEKFHEVLINENEIRKTYESKDDYIIYDNDTQNYDYEKIPNIKKSTLTDRYSSNKVELLTKNELKQILINENLVT